MQVAEPPVWSESALQAPLLQWAGWVHPVAKAFVQHLTDWVGTYWWLSQSGFLVLQYRYIYYVVNQLMCRFAMAWSWKNQSNCLLMLGFLSEKKVRRRGTRINFTPTRKFWTIMENYSWTTDFVQLVLFFRGSTWCYFHLQPAAPNLQLTKYK